MVCIGGARYQFMCWKCHMHGFCVYISFIHLVPGFQTAFWVPLSHGEELRKLEYSWSKSWRKCLGITVFDFDFDFDSCILLEDELHKAEGEKNIWAVLAQPELRPQRMSILVSMWRTIFPTCLKENKHLMKAITGIELFFSLSWAVCWLLAPSTKSETQVLISNRFNWVCTIDHSTVLM